MKNLFTVEGKVIVITGATGILGQSMVAHFAEQGAKVVILGRNAEVGLRQQEEARAAGGEAHQKERLNNRRRSRHLSFSEKFRNNGKAYKYSCFYSS